MTKWDYVTWVIIFIGMLAALCCFVAGLAIHIEPKKQVEPSQGVTVDIGPGCIDIQAPSFNGRCERCPEDCR